MTIDRVPRTDPEKLRFISEWIRQRDNSVIESLNGDPNIEIDNYFPNEADGQHLGSEVADDLERIAGDVEGAAMFRQTMLEGSRSYSHVLARHAMSLGILGTMGYSLLLLAVVSWSWLSILFVAVGVGIMVYSYRRKDTIHKNIDSLHDNLEKINREEME